MARELLLEVGVEELPAAFLPKAMEDLRTGAAVLLREKAIRHGEIVVLATPRRLCLYCEDVAARQEDRVVEKIGPAVAGAYDGAGNPSKAVLGFARGQGVEIAELEVEKTPKGDYLVARKRMAGGETKELLPELLPTLLRSLPFKRSMRWSNFSLRFARPIHWIVALYAGEVMPFTMENVQSGRTTRGHRFMAPGGIVVDGFADYQSKLREAFVVTSPEARREMIVARAQEAAGAVGGKVLFSDDLLTEVTFLVEYPNAICGSFPAAYLALPREVLTTTMMSHQRYFPVVDAAGEILPYFIAITNTEAKSPEVVKGGNEKVIRARLKDAEFFFHEDQKLSLSARVEGLKKVVYHSQMGTSFEKVKRFQMLAEYLAQIVAPHKVEEVRRAAFLAKADLDTQMVGEFPELQGLMGREYALRGGETEEVARAIYEHYLPVVAGGGLPTADVGAVVSIADKMDTIVGFFGIGLAPTGTADPYALRRQALGIINIVIARNYSCSLRGLIGQSLTLLGEKLQRDRQAVGEEVFAFFRARLENLLVTQGYSHDIVDAVCSVGTDDVILTVKKVQAMERFRQDEDYEPLAIAFKRVRNIIKGFSDGKIVPTLFAQEAEANLYGRYLEVRSRVEALIDGGNIQDALGEMARLRAPMDDFFEEVMVMDEDTDIRFNRQSLLAEIFGFFSHIADFSRISVEQKQKR